MTCDIWPNITGTYEADYLTWVYEQIAKSTTGAFYSYKSARTAGATGGIATPAGIGLRANSSNDLYGKSNTIQPQSARTIFIVKI